MWQLIGLAVIAVFMMFAFVVVFGAPFLPTLKPQISASFELLNLKPGQQILELGSGDGRMLVAAAKKGIHATGYELNPLLFIYSWLLTRRYSKYANVIWGNYWKKQWPQTDAIFVFLLSKYMSKLDNKITQECIKPVKLVSVAFKIPNKKIDQEQDGVFLYLYK